MTAVKICSERSLLSSDARDARASGGFVHQAHRGAHHVVRALGGGDPPGDVGGECQAAGALLRLAAQPCAAERRSHLLGDGPHQQLVLGLEPVGRHVVQLQHRHHHAVDQDRHDQAGLVVVLAGPPADPVGRRLARLAHDLAGREHVARHPFRARPAQTDRPAARRRSHRDQHLLVAVGAHRVDRGAFQGAEQRVHRGLQGGVDAFRTDDRSGHVEGQRQPVGAPLRLLAQPPRADRDRQLLGDRLHRHLVPGVEPVLLLRPRPDGGDALAVHVDRRDDGRPVGLVGLPVVRVVAVGAPAAERQAGAQRAAADAGVQRPPEPGLRRLAPRLVGHVHLHTRGPVGHRDGHAVVAGVVADGARDVLQHLVQRPRRRHQLGHLRGQRQPVRAALGLVAVAEAAPGGGKLLGDQRHQRRVGLVERVAGLDHVQRGDGLSLDDHRHHQQRAVLAGGAHGLLRRQRDADRPRPQWPAHRRERPRRPHLDQVQLLARLVEHQGGRHPPEPGRPVRRPRGQLERLLDRRGGRHRLGDAGRDVEAPGSPLGLLAQADAAERGRQLVGGDPQQRGVRLAVAVALGVRQLEHGLAAAVDDHRGEQHRVEHLGVGVPRVARIVAGVAHQQLLVAGHDGADQPLADRAPMPDGGVRPPRPVGDDHLLSGLVVDQRAGDALVPGQGEQLVHRRLERAGQRPGGCRRGRDRSGELEQPLELVRRGWAGSGVTHLQDCGR